MKKEKCPKCGGEIFSVEYYGTDPHHYDGVSEYACVNSFSHTTVEEGAPIMKGKCDYRVGRWCGQELKKNEVEPRFCEGEEHPKLHEKTTRSN